MASNPERCKRCAHHLTFAEFDTNGARILACAQNLTSKKSGESAHTMVPCAPPDEFILAGRYLKKENISWRRRADEWQRRSG